MEQDPWFTRGWTLQELLAPRRLAFYSKEWRQITKSDSIKRPIEPIEVVNRRMANGDMILWHRIAKITGIDLNDLLEFKPGVYDVRKRMTWASKRNTTRIEDMAYCLIGIFKVNLSIAYGEKEAAFYRLQVEILQNSNDISLFDWQDPTSEFNSLRKDVSLPAGNDPTFAQTNLGIRIPLAIYPWSQQLLRGFGPNLPNTPMVFSILGASSQPDDYVLLLLKEGDQPQQYERLGLIRRHLRIESFKQAPVVVYIK
ncbi:hypothetical protein FRC17_011061 [Serendipita sp. 399]|nr:hypothetical protein FRC17_011061 [Serendipita sp. 399]